MAGDSNLRRFIQARRQPTWNEQHFPTVELPKFLEKFVDGLVFALLSVRAWLMVTVTCLVTLLCSPALLDLSWDSSMSIVAVGTVFPLVFAIQAAYNSRNQALKFLGQLKARMMYLYFHSKALDAKYETELAPRAYAFSSSLGIAVIQSLNRNDKESAHVCYDLISELISEMTAAAVDKVPHPLFNLLSNTFQSLLLDLEGVREVRDNETPKGLRKFAIFLICVTPIMLAPYWSHFCGTASGGEISQVYTVNDEGAIVPLTAGDGGEGIAPNHPFGCIAGYFIAVLYVIITFSLLRVQEALEDPFDGMGEDDIQWQNFARHLDQVDLYGADGVDKRQQAPKLLEPLYQGDAGKGD